MLSYSRWEGSSLIRLGGSMVVVVLVVVVLVVVGGSMLVPFYQDLQLNMHMAGE